MSGGLKGFLLQPPCVMMKPAESASLCLRASSQYSNVVTEILGPVQHAGESVQKKPCVEKKTKNLLFSTVSVHCD